jgi:hypothetical protein
LVKSLSDNLPLRFNRVKNSAYFSAAVTVSMINLIA